MTLAFGLRTSVLCSPVVTERLSQGLPRILEDPSNLVSQRCSDLEIEIQVGYGRFAAPTDLVAHCAAKFGAADYIAHTLR